MYVPVGTTGVILSGEQEFALQRSKAALPTCWAKEAEDCITGVNPTDFPNCATIRQGYEIDEQGMIDAVNAVPFCPAPTPCPTTAAAAAAEPCPPCPAPSETPPASRPSPLWFALAGAAGVVIGHFVWR